LVGAEGEGRTGEKVTEKGMGRDGEEGGSTRNMSKAKRGRQTEKG